MIEVLYKGQEKITYVQGIPRVVSNAKKVQAVATSDPPYSKSFGQKMVGILIQNNNRIVEKNNPNPKANHAEAKNRKKVENKNTENIHKLQELEQTNGLL